MPRFIVLLRAVNVGGRKAPMAELREACLAVGFRDVATYIQSGNLVLSSELPLPEIEAAIEEIIRRRFGFPAEAIARSAKQWSAYAAGTPFPEAEAERAKHLLLCLSKLPPKPDAAERLLEHALAGERIVLSRDALWIDYVGGVGASKLTPALLDRCAGSPVTGRNWNTVLQLHALAGATPS